MLTLALRCRRAMHLRVFTPLGGERRHRALDEHRPDMAREQSRYMAMPRLRVDTGSAAYAGSYTQALTSKLKL